MMNINEAIETIKNGKMVRNENFAGGTYCWLNSDGTIEDPEMGPCTEEEFRKFYKYFTEDWYIYA